MFSLVWGTCVYLCQALPTEPKFVDFFIGYVNKFKVIMYLSKINIDFNFYSEFLNKRGF